MPATLRRILIALAGVAVAALAVSGVTKNEDHGVLEVVSNASWLLVICSLAAIVVVGTVGLVRGRRTSR